MQPYINHSTTLGTGLCPSHTQKSIIGRVSSGNFQRSYQNSIIMASTNVVVGIAVYEWIEHKMLYKP